MIVVSWEESKLVDGTEKPPVVSGKLGLSGGDFEYVVQLSGGIERCDRGIEVRLIAAQACENLHGRLCGIVPVGRRTRAQARMELGICVDLAASA